MSKRLHRGEIFALHRGGKIKVTAATPIRTMKRLSQIYTPGVAAVCKAIFENPDLAYSHTMKGRMVAVITDSSRVLSLGNIGAAAGLPVMEGKVALICEFAGINAFPLSLKTQDPDKIVEAVSILEPNFGGVILEDIRSPECWEIERRLKEVLTIPIFHDDQHGTSVVVTAATLNALEVVNKRIEEIKIVACGVGAAGMASCRMLIAAGARNLIGFKREGAVYRGRSDLNNEERWLADNSNPENYQGTMKDALEGADMFLGLSAGNILKAKDVRRMKRDAIIFALANPIPEILPPRALPYVAVMATGSSRWPNQINNALAFPGIAKGALACRAGEITEAMKMEAAREIARIVPRSKLAPDYIIPDVFHPRVHNAVARAVMRVDRR